MKREYNTIAGKQVALTMTPELVKALLLSAHGTPEARLVPVLAQRFYHGSCVVLPEG